jgi:electron transport protein HydN
MNNLVIADPDRCIGCRTCEVACVLAHTRGEALEGLSAARFIPRLKVVRVSRVTAPVQCRQCDDAPCAKVCPTGALVHRHNSVQVIQSQCIGCKSCMMACLYGAIEVVFREPPVPEPRISSFPVSSGPARVQALKCDLCWERSEGPACLKVCPTKAISLVDGSVLAERIRLRREHAAAALAEL